MHPLYTNDDRIHDESLCGTWTDKDGNIVEVTSHTSEFILKELKYFKTEKGKLENKSTPFKKYEKKNLESYRALFALAEKNKTEARFQRYHIKYISDGDTCIYIGRLSKLKKHIFIDIIPEEDNLEEKINNPYLIGMVIPLHGFIKIQKQGDELKLNWTLPEKFKRTQVRLKTTMRKSKIKTPESDKKKDSYPFFMPITPNELYEHRWYINAKTSDIQKFLIKYADTELFNDKRAELILKRIK
jgi:hypothetical protein